jgi:hypothetical protein
LRPIFPNIAVKASARYGERHEIAESSVLAHRVPLRRPHTNKPA